MLHPTNNMAYIPQSEQGNGVSQTQPPDTLCSRSLSPCLMQQH